MSDTQCQRLNVRYSISETQFRRLNVRDSMSESDLQTWLILFPTPLTSGYNMILVFKGIVDLSCSVLHSWHDARPSVNADWQLTASMSSVVFFSAEAQIALAQIETAVGSHRRACGGGIMMIVQLIWWSLRGFEGRWVDMRVDEWIWERLSGCEGHWVDMTVIKLTLSDLSEKLRNVCIIYQWILDVLWPTLMAAMIRLLPMAQDVARAM